MDIGELIYTKRREKNMSQEALAHELQVARQTIGKWESNETLPDLLNMQKLATILEFSIDKALEIEVEDKDDVWENLILGVFIIGNLSAMLLFLYKIL